MANIYYSSLLCFFSLSYKRIYTKHINHFSLPQFTLETLNSPLSLNCWFVLQVVLHLYQNIQQLSHHEHSTIISSQIFSRVWTKFEFLWDCNLYCSSFINCSIPLIKCSSHQWEPHNNETFPGLLYHFSLRSQSCVNI